MSNIDRQRVAAVRKLEAHGLHLRHRRLDAARRRCRRDPPITDALHALLVARADQLAGSTEGSDEERELEMITDAVRAYEAVRWPGGKVPGGKG